MLNQNDFLNLVNEYRPLIKEINVNDVKTKLDQNEDFILVDVREDNEWIRGHIPNAIHLSKGIIERDIIKLIPNKQTEIVLYCGSGFRSVLSAYNLQKIGYLNVSSMEEGISGWVNLGQKIVI